MAVAVEDRITDAARAAVVETAGDESPVGDMLGSEPGADGLVSVRFACMLPGYHGWEWAVDLAVIDDTVTVCESALLPGSDALLGPTWVPWSERVQPGDLEPGMILPYQAEDPRLIPGYTETGDEDRDAIANFEFGLGRERVLAPEAREAAAQRWYRGSHGPTAASAVAAGAVCATCAFALPVAGSMRTMFGVCANEWSPSDGRVVSMDHGCGAHSQTDAERRASEWPGLDPVIDSAALDALDLTTPDPEPEPEAVTEPVAEPEADPAADPAAETEQEATPQDAEQDKAPQAPAE
ncbi:DUF3027 domain-containing protein [Demequina sp.]|uniref:DUF3027 domain-containing protein n=1 Tax=Demequina sp. TaxID=2050685 RepID=UPI0025C062D9|nr:DUF3027 domain-containing protein [Demequina sp.]